MEIIIGSWRVAIEQVSPSVEELSQKYSLAAPRWHQSIQRMGFIRAYQSIFSQLRDSCYSEQPAFELDVLDVGIGTGGLAQALIAEDPRPIHLTGIDISAEMLEETRSNLKAQVSSMDLQQQDVQRLNLPDHQFDLVMGAHVLEHLDDIRPGLSEMARVAKPGATVLLVVTRRSLASAWLHLIWQIKMSNGQEVSDVFRQVGLEKVQLVRFQAPIWCNWMSIAIIGTKPARL
ncbi:MAG: class I SAM-dependent methyltransferase [Anaerolineae bacterium]